MESRRKALGIACGELLNYLSQPVGLPEVFREITAAIASGYRSDRKNYLRQTSGLPQVIFMYC